MITQQECTIILEMLASGRITADEADRLFTAIELCADSEQRADSEQLVRQDIKAGPGWASMRAWSEQVRGELYSELQSNLSRVLGRAKTSFVYIR